MPMNDLMIRPMREELTRNGFEELRTPEEVDRELKREGTTLVAVNSVCGCASGKMRPAIVHALRNAAAPDRAVTVFAGQDADATARAREYFTGYEPSSPSVALLKDGELVFMLERSDIFPREASSIADDIVEALNRYCS